MRERAPSVKRIDPVAHLVKLLREASIDKEKATGHLYWEAARMLNTLTLRIERLEEENNALTRPGTTPETMIRLRRLLMQERTRAERAERKLKQT